MIRPLASRSRVRTAFTLVELLVVIGIIAMLISILLPSLNKVRRQAATLKCSSNMRQIAQAVLLYANDNKGDLPPTIVQVGTTLYPDGWWFPSDLVRLRYIQAPNNYPKAGGPIDFSGSSVFRCPEGVMEDIAAGFGAGRWPTDSINNAYSIQNSARAQAMGFGVATWYMFNTGNVSNANKLSNNGGALAGPFTAFNGQTDDAAVRAALNNADYKRKLSKIRRATELVMVVEAASPNWTIIGSPVVPDNQVPRLGARHGARTADGHDAYTNFAFFDGHVASFPTQPISKSGLAAFTNDTIFYLGKAR